MAPSDSMTERAGPTRSVAPTIATERGLTSGSSCISLTLARAVVERLSAVAPQENARKSTPLAIQWLSPTFLLTITAPGSRESTVWLPMGFPTLGSHHHEARRQDHRHALPAAGQG